MSYQTRLYWAGGRGFAKLEGEQVRIPSCPQIFPGVVIDAMDYVPGVIAQYMPRFMGWADMSGEQMAACDAYIREVFGAERRES
jgi:hypothetical protein